MVLRRKPIILRIKQGVFIMAKLLDKMMNLVGWEDREPAGEENNALEEDQTQEYKKTTGLKRNQQNKIVNINSQGHFKVVIHNPQSFEQAREITEHLKGKKAVVVNVEGLDKNLAQRIVDFLSGSVYALNGNIQKVTNGIILVAPQNVDIQGGLIESFDETGSFSWIK